MLTIVFPLLLAVSFPQVFVHIHSTPTEPVFSVESPVISQVLILSLPVLYMACAALHSAVRHQDRWKLGSAYLF